MGWMVFSKWRLDPNSLIEFFTYHMEKDNWKLVNSFKGKESFLNFSKPDKTCTIKISENWLGKTEVEIRVGPWGRRRCKRLLCCFTVSKGPLTTTIY